MSTPQQRYHPTNAGCIDLTSLMSVQLMCMVKANKDAIGVPPEFTFYPLLTAVAACMVVNAFMHVNSVWREPCTMWFVVAARRKRLLL